MDASQFCKLDASGLELPVDATDWSMVLDRSTGLMWPRDPLEKELRWKDAGPACAAFRLGGFEDWRFSTRRELLSLVDDTRFSPAINTDFFRCPSDAFWTSTPDPSSPESYAFYVYFGDGLSNIGSQHYRLWVRPVRSVVLPGQ